MTTLRETGIEGMALAPWGTHLCSLYHTRDDLQDVVLPFLSLGLESNELCIWVASDPLSEEEALEGLREINAEIDYHIDHGQFRTVPHADWYLRDGDFSIQRVLDTAAEAYDHALSEGYAGLRAAGNLSWATEDLWEDISRYEMELDKAISGSRMLVLCTYSLDQCGEQQVSDVVENHGFALRRRRHWSLSDTSEKSQATRQIMVRKSVRDELEGLSLETRLEDIMRQMAEEELETAGKPQWSRVANTWRASCELLKQLEEWGGVAGALIDTAEDVDCLSEELSELYRRLSGSRRMRAWADSRSMVFEAEGCPSVAECTRKLEEDGLRFPCPPGIVVSALLSAATQTPVRSHARLEGDLCFRKFTPDWVVGVLEALEGVEATGVLVVSGDRVAYSSALGRVEADALNEVLLRYEELSDVSEIGAVEASGTKVLNMQLGKILVSVTTKREVPESYLQALRERMRLALE